MGWVMPYLGCCTTEKGSLMSSIRALVQAVIAATHSRSPAIPRYFCVGDNHSETFLFAECYGVTLYHSTHI